MELKVDLNKYTDDLLDDLMNICFNYVSYYDNEHKFSKVDKAIDEIKEEIINRTY